MIREVIECSCETTIHMVDVVARLMQIREMMPNPRLIGVACPTCGKNHPLLEGEFDEISKAADRATAAIALGDTDAAQAVATAARRLLQVQSRHAAFLLTLAQALRLGDKVSEERIVVRVRDLAATAISQARNYVVLCDSDPPHTRYHCSRIEPIEWTHDYARALHMNADAAADVVRRVPGAWMASIEDSAAGDGEQVPGTATSGPEAGGDPAADAADPSSPPFGPPAPVPAAEALLGAIGRLEIARNMQPAPANAQLVSDALEILLHLAQQGFTHDDAMTVAKAAITRVEAHIEWRPEESASWPSGLRLRKLDTQSWPSEVALDRVLVLQVPDTMTRDEFYASLGHAGNAVPLFDDFASRVILRRILGTTYAQNDLELLRAGLTVVLDMPSDATDEEILSAAATARAAEAQDAIDVLPEPWQSRLLGNDAELCQRGRGTSASIVAGSEGEKIVAYAREIPARVLLLWLQGMLAHPPVDFDAVARDTALAQRD